MRFFLFFSIANGICIFVGYRIMDTIAVGGRIPISFPVEVFEFEIFTSLKCILKQLKGEGYRSTNS